MYTHEASHLIYMVSEVESVIVVELVAPCEWTILFKREICVEFIIALTVSSGVIKLRHT